MPYLEAETAGLAFARAGQPLVDLGEEAFGRAAAELGPPGLRCEEADVWRAPERKGGRGVGTGTDMNEYPHV